MPVTVSAKGEIKMNENTFQSTSIKPEMNFKCLRIFMSLMSVETANWTVCQVRYVDVEYTDFAKLKKYDPN